MKKRICFLSNCFVFILILASNSNVAQNCTIEDINDIEILKYPVLKPVDPRSHSFVVSTSDYTEEIEVNSPNFRNLSITIENIGAGVIKNPYLFWTSRMGLSRRLYFSPVSCNKHHS